jgi:predicted phage tail protein
LLTKIKIHSAYKNIFSQSEYTADLTRYGDLPFYLGSMHPKFRNYANAIHTGDCQEGYSLLDKTLKVVEEEDLYIKKIKQDDVFYVVPAIVGGGGKRTTTLLAVAALGIATGGFGLGAAGGAATGTAAAGGGFAFGSFAQTLGVNIGLALVTSLFTKREKIKETDQNIRENDMFGGLQNTVNSGTPIPLIYGMHRVAGQLISGYLDTVDHGKSDTITVASRFET